MLECRQALLRPVHMLDERTMQVRSLWHTVRLSRFATAAVLRPPDSRRGAIGSNEPRACFSSNHEQQPAHTPWDDIERWSSLELTNVRYASPSHSIL
jgi:hypothetical protein